MAAMKRIKSAEEKVLRNLFRDERKIEKKLSNVERFNALFKEVK